KEIDSNFRDIPLNRYVKIIDTERAAMLSYLQNEAAGGIQAANPALSSGEALQQANKLYRESAGIKGEGKPSLDTMIRHREEVRKNIRQLSKPGQSEVGSEPIEADIDVSGISNKDERAKIQVQLEKAKRERAQAVRDRNINISIREKELKAREKEQAQNLAAREKEMKWQYAMAKDGQREQKELTLINAGLSLFSQTITGAFQSLMQLATNTASAMTQSLHAAVGQVAVLGRDHIVPGMFGGRRG
ncbi:MAG TPA: hypothetical protein DF383_01590, partial [Deltaproteobacteria bacterium]|nr:hypothetical protein [Deltaproteobacteria bacterium]